MAFPCGYNHSMASCASSTWQWPMGGGENTCTWATSWRHPDSHQQTSVHLLMHAPRYSVKGGNIPPERRYSLVDQASMAASPVFGEAPPRLAEKGKKLTFLLHWFQQCSSLRPFTKSLYYIWELCRTGGFVSVECRAGHIFSLWLNPQWRLLLDQEAFAKYMVLWISAHFQTKQSPWTTQYHKEQMFWHLFLSHYMCWLGPHNNIIIMMIRIWYLVRENDDDAEEDDCGDACLVLANITCPRTGLHFTFSSRLHTGPSLNITYH